VEDLKFGIFYRKAGIELTGDPKSHKVSLFIQCLVDSHYPHVGMAMVTVFEKLGVALSCPTDQTCCGQPAFNAGYRNEARIAARRFIEIFEHAEAIVCPSGVCVTMVRHHYPLLFSGDRSWQGRAEAVAKKTFEFSQYLVDVLGVTDIGAAFRCRATYHDSCHLLRSLGVGRQPRALLGRVRDLVLVEMRRSDECCGFGGAFSVKYPDISAALVDDKVNHIHETDADIVVGCDMGCLMNIQGRLNRIGSTVNAMHIAEVLCRC
jgi:L-lactate dehydrogenase complex protein LldE